MYSITTSGGLKLCVDEGGYRHGETYCIIHDSKLNLPWKCNVEALRSILQDRFKVAPQEAESLYKGIKFYGGLIH